MGLQFGVSYKGGDYEYVRVRRWPFSIGRNPANDLCLANSSLISRRHVRVFKEEDGYRLIASGRNPTYLNGKAVKPGEPVEIQPGDRIELPNYLLEVRDPSQKDKISATVNVEVVTNSVIIVRRVASMIGTRSWTAEAIHNWLKNCRGREIWIQHQQVALCLPDRLTLDQLSQRLELFDQLIADLDPHSLVIEVVDPLASTAS
jgi:pSer/pThr/pTyr-binding forkhead associated (FHA) protein